MTEISMQKKVIGGNPFQVWKVNKATAELLEIH